MCDVPVLGLGLAAQGGGHLSRRVHLEAQAVRAVQPLHEDREGPLHVPLRTHELRTVAQDELAQGRAAEAAATDPGLGLGPVDDLPAFADRRSRREIAAEQGFEAATAPHPFLVNC